ncbi:hypothetical protein, partial [Armatimonas sp.]|uniref:hypothetical protein n=1 Tax=Armatimonas sp. TaxID=1872638 RepID=UPI00286C7743
FTLTDEVCQHCLKQVGWPLPYYLQLIFHSLKELPQQRTADFPRITDIDAAYAALLQPHHDALFAHWHSRLAEQFESPDALRIAHELLRTLCTKPRGIKRDTLIATLQARLLNSDTEQIGQQARQILNILERDGYLLRSPNETISFRSFLLRDFWKRRYT